MAWMPCAIVTYVCRKGLQQQQEAVACEVHERREGVEDLSEVLQCVRDQAAAAAGSKAQLKVGLCCHQLHDTQPAGSSLCAAMAGLLTVL